MEPTNEYLTSIEAAAYMHVSDRTIRNLCKDRLLRHELWNGRIYRFKKEWLDEYLQSITVEPIKKENEK